MVDREHPKLPMCALLVVSRSTLYYRLKAASEEDLTSALSLLALSM